MLRTFIDIKTLSRPTFDLKGLTSQVFMEILKGWSNRRSYLAVPLKIKRQLSLKRKEKRRLWQSPILKPEFQFRGSVHHTMIIENTSVMQQDKYICTVL